MATLEGSADLDRRRYADGAARIAWKRYQYEVEELMAAGVAFSQVEDAINDADVRDDAKSALWLLAWSLRDPSHQQQDARATLALIATYGE